MGKLSLIDSHRHLTHGAFDVEECISQLDKDGIEKTVLFGYHGFVFQEERVQDREVMNAAEKFPERIVPFICDIDFNDADFLSYVDQQLSAGAFKGVGEILIGHSVIKDLHFKDICLDDPRMIELSRLAADHEVPVLVHVDTPFLAEFERLLKACKETTFIAAHVLYDFLSSFGGKEIEPEKVRMMLQEYPRLYFDISLWKISPLYLTARPWLELLYNYKDRFLFGTDMTDSYLQQSVWMEAYKKIFDLLRSFEGKRTSSPISAADRIGGMNFQKMLAGQAG